MKKNKITYSIVLFKNNESTGHTIKKRYLNTIYYCLRDCVNSGLYKTIVFRVKSTDTKSGFSSDSPVLIYENGIIKLCDGLTEYGKRKYKHYLTRYNTYLKTH